MEVGARLIPYDQMLVRTDVDAFELRAETAGLRVDVGGRQVTVDAPNEGLALQLVTTYGLPLLLEDAADVLVLHACAAVPPGSDDAVVICARSGTGKSTLLLGLLDAGWRAVSEDVCSIDLRDDRRPRVWPGPPWLRRAGRGPVGSVPRYELPDKTAWDISPVLADEPVTVGRVVFLEPAGGDEIVWSFLEPGRALAGLTSSSIRLSDPERRAQLTFGTTALVASRVPAARLRLPVSDDWTVLAEGALRRDPPKR